MGAEPVPPVPGKQGTKGPREGFSTARLRLPRPEVPGDVARAPLASQAAFNILAIRVAFSDTPIDSSAAYYNRLLFFQKQFWEQSTGGVAILNADDPRVLAMAERTEARVVTFSAAPGSPGMSRAPVRAADIRLDELGRHEAAGAPLAGQLPLARVQIQ